MKITKNKSWLRLALMTMMVTLCMSFGILASSALPTAGIVTYNFSQNIVNLYVSDQTASTTFKGISTTVYHCTTFMNDIKGRNYTDEMAAIEMDRLKDAGITTVRSIFKSGYAWKPDNSVAPGVGIPWGEWDWDSDHMKAFYKCAGMLQDRGIDIVLNAGWHLDEIINEGSDQRETPYLWGVDTWDNKPVTDHYFESFNAGFEPTGDTDKDRITRASLRYAEWIRQALEAFKSRGIHNVKYLVLFTEPCIPRTSPIGLEIGVFDPESGKVSLFNHADVWIEMATALHNRLERAPSIRGNYKLIGPNQLNVSERFGNGYQAGLLKYVLDPTKMNPDVIDIFSSHFYPGGDGQSPRSIYGDTYGAVSDGFFSEFRTAMNNSASLANREKDFWCDEFFAKGSDSKLRDDSPWAGTQTAVGITSAMNNGIDGIISWQFTDQLWPNLNNSPLIQSPDGGEGTEFDNGYHVTGMAPSLLRSYLPKSQYYAVGLASRYLGGTRDGTVYKSSSSVANAGLYIGTVKRADGKWTVLVVNAGPKTTTFRVNFSSSLGVNGQTFYRHLYDPASVFPTVEAKLAGADINLTVASNAFTDTIPSGGVAVYTTDTINSSGGGGGDGGRGGRGGSGGSSGCNTGFFPLVCFIIPLLWRRK